jgi:transcriptional activator of cad operon
MPTQESSGFVQVGEWIVNPSLDSISRGGETQKLEPRTMRLLMCLANSASEVVSVDRLLTEVWVDVVVGSASVYEAVSQLRKILGDVGPNPSYIVTVPRKGYRLIASVQRGTGPVQASQVQEAARKLVPSLLIWTIAGAFAVLASVAAYFFVGRGNLSIHETTVSDDVVNSKSIAVLPFTDMSEKRDQEYFADGMSEELIGLLTQVPGLHVPARTSSF